jgi:single-stranded DNA-specific DHH superfamily exonuclease
MKGSDDVLVGSLRSKEGFNILKAISSDKINLLSGGGHAFAGGVSIKKSDFESFKKEFIFAALKHKFSPGKKKLIPLNLSEATMENANLVATFSPFGQEWGAPSFLLSKLDSKEFTYTSNGKYLSYRLPNGVRLFSFSISEDSFINDEKVDLAVSFSPNEFKGRMYLDLLAEKA